jgi:hypothetical protein
VSSLLRIVFDPDNIPPSTPVILSVTAVGQNRLDVTWTSVLDTGGAGLAGYNLLIDGATTVELGVQTSYSHVGIAASSTHTYRVQSRDAAGNLSSLSVQASGQAAAAPPVPGAYNPDYPRFGSYALGGTQNASNAALAATHVNVVIHWPGWQTSKGITWATKAAQVKELSTIGTKIVPYTINTEIQDIYSASGTSENDVWRYVSDNGLWVYQNGLTKANRIPSYQSGWSKINFTTAAEQINGETFSQWKIRRDYSFNVQGGSINNGSQTLAATANPTGFDGVFFDNAFSREQPAVNGATGDYNRDGTQDTLSSATSINLIQSSHAANVAFYRQLHPDALVLGNSNIWPIYHPAGITGMPLDQVFDGGVLEYIEEWAGYTGPGGVVRGTTFASLLNAIRVQMNAYRVPKLGVLSVFITSATNYQQLRYWHGIAALTDTYYYPHLTSGLLAQELNTLSYDEKTFQLGTAIDPVQYTPRYQSGANGAGIYVRRFQRGEVWVWAQGGTYTAQSTPVDLWRLIGTNNAANTGAKVSANGTIPGTAGDCAVFTYIAQDQTAPTVPGSLSGSTVSSSQINLAWNASTDSGGSGLAGYKVERATSMSGPWTQIADQTGTSVSATGLTANTTYHFRVRAYDRAQNHSAFSTTTSAQTQGGAGIYFSEDYTAPATGNVSLTSAWTSRGYTSIENSGSSSALQVLTRSSMPAGLLADPNFPSGKARVLQVTLGGNEQQARVLWEGMPSGVRTAWFSWWEYRDNNRKGGEKFCRLGNKLSNGNRGHDIIWTLGNVTGLTLIANSASMFDYGDQSFGQALNPWPPGLIHCEVGLTLSTATNANGSSEFWMNGTRVANVTGIRMNRDTTDAARNIDLWDIGGWSSTGGGTEGSVTYPIVRYLCALRVASTRQGVWGMS